MDRGAIIFLDEILAEDYDQGVSRVREGKAQAMIAGMPICQLSVYRYPDADLATLKNPLSYEPLGIAFPPHDPLFVNCRQNFLTPYEKDGSMKIQMEKWSGDGSWIDRLR